MQNNYVEFGPWLASKTGGKTQKIAVDAGFTCPNRDGTIGSGGCTYCNNRTFTPDYCQPSKSITEQLKEGKAFFARKYPRMLYLAYFQAYTNTYAPVKVLARCFEEALHVDGIVGLVIATRPDCMSDEVLDLLQNLRRRCFVLVEYGVESIYEVTLNRINRGHTFVQSRDAICRTADRGIEVGAHIIVGLPGETPDMVLNEAEVLSDLPLSTLKLHQLQIIRHTPMAREFCLCPDDFMQLTPDSYADLVARFIMHSRSDMVFDRFVSTSPPQLLFDQGWGLKNYEFTAILNQKLQQLKTIGE